MSGQDSFSMPLAAGGLRRLLFPTDDTFWFEISRAFGSAEYGAALFGEVLAAATNIVEGDFQSWYVAFNTLADRIANEAEAQFARGHTASARDSYLRASNYYFASEFFLHGEPTDPRIARAYRLCVANYKKAGSLFEPPIAPVDIPYEGTHLPGYLHRPDRSDSPKPTIIIHTGFDGSAEEMHVMGARAGVERGYNVLAFDGPGQYGALHAQGLVFRPDWEKVIGPVVDFLLARPDVDTRHIVLIGISLGGVLAPRAAAFEPRLAALVANDGIYDFATSLLGAVPAERREGFVDAVRAPEAPEIDQFFAAQLTGADSTRWVLQHGMWATGSSTPREFMRKMLDYNLRNGVAERITCPTLVCSAEGDLATKGQPEELFAHLTSAKKQLIHFTNSEGAGAHTEIGASRLALGRIFDWLDETIDGA
jgi:alpha-beta hydrolase superfamily lysophospholipase